MDHDYLYIYCYLDLHYFEDILKTLVVIIIDLVVVEQKGNFGHDDLESNLLDHEMHFVPGNSEICKHIIKYIRT